MLLNILVAAGLCLLLGAVWIALQQAKRANIMTGMAIMERILGNNHPQMQRLTADLLPFERRSVDELLKALRISSETGMNTEIVMAGPVVLEKLLSELKHFADKVIMVRVIMDPAINDIGAALLRVYKGDKFFSLAFYTRRVPVDQDNQVPKDLRSLIQLQKNGLSSIVVAYPCAAILGSNGYQVKQDFLDGIYAIAGCPDIFKLGTSGNIFFRLEKGFGEDLYPKPILKRPSTGYIEVFPERELTIQYHGNSYVVTQEKALSLLADIVIARERATVVLNGAPNSGKTAFMAFLQEKLAGNPKVKQVIIGNNADLQALIAVEGRTLLNRWAEEREDVIRVICIDDAIGDLENPQFTQSLLSFMDGQLKNLTNMVLVLSVNRSLDKVPADLKRPGRMSVIVNFPEIDATEAHDLVAEISKKIMPPKQIEDRTQPGKTYQIGEIFDWVTDQETQDSLEKVLVDAQKQKEGNQKKTPAEQPKQPAVTAAPVKKGFRRKR